MKIGLISDTHDYLDPFVPAVFKGMDHILHAGDIGRNSILMQLEAVAPVTAVIGNTDSELPCRQTEVVQLGQWKFLLNHIVPLESPDNPIHERIQRERPDVVLFGHTHQAFARILDKTFFINPGYAGRPKPGQSRSVVILHCQPGELRPEFIPLLD